MVKEEGKPISCNVNTTKRGCLLRKEKDVVTDLQQSSKSKLIACLQRLESGNNFIVLLQFNNTSNVCKIRITKITGNGYRFVLTFSESANQAFQSFH